jgi:DNA-binding CsgD family transcriptional regulator
VAELTQAVRDFQGSARSSVAMELDIGEVRLTRISAGSSIRFLVELPVRRGRTRGERLLSKAQIQVARRAAEGATLREIARMLSRSPDTVRSHLREIYRRLDVANRIELARALANPEGG